MIIHTFAAETSMCMRMDGCYRGVMNSPVYAQICVSQIWKILNSEAYQGICVESD